MLFLFVCLSEVAETFFSPIMGQIADELGFSHNMAGEYTLSSGWLMEDKVCAKFHCANSLHLSKR